MSSRQQTEILAVAILYLCAFIWVIGPVLASTAGLEQLSTAGATGIIARNWELVSKPQGWIMCFGYVPIHFSYLIVRARFAGESVDSYWE